MFLAHSFHTGYDHIRTADLYHFINDDIFGNGSLGVNFFFVLSGFLITYLLIEEKKFNGQIDIVRFWIRRILRIWPLFYLCIIMGFFIFPFFKSYFGQSPNESASLVHYLTFTNNFDYISKGTPDASILAVLWSIAVEEQFYFVWPIILYLLPIKKYWLAFSTVIMASLIFRAFNNNYTAHQYHTLSCIGDMAIGAFGAWLTQTDEKFKIRIQTLKPAYIWVIYISMAIVYLFRDEILSVDIFLLDVLERPFIAIIIILIILEQCFSEKSLFKMSDWKLFTKWGTMSYGLYCFHFVGILVVTTLTKLYSLNTHLWQVLIIETSFAFVLTIIISSVSYNNFEKPFLKLKDKFAYIKK